MSPACTLIPWKVKEPLYLQGPAAADIESSNEKQ